MLKLLVLSDLYITFLIHELEKDNTEIDSKIAKMITQLEY